MRPANLNVVVVVVHLPFTSVFELKQAIEYDLATAALGQLLCSRIRIVLHYKAINLHTDGTLYISCKVG